MAAVNIETTAQPRAAIHSLQRREFLPDARNDIAVLRRRGFRQKGLETRARALLFARHFVQETEIHVHLDQIGIEPRSLLEVAARGIRILLLNANEPHTVLCLRAIGIVREDEFEYALGVRYP